MSETLYVHDCQNEHHGTQCRTTPCHCDCHGGDGAAPCGLYKPGGTTTCIEPVGHNGSHGDGSVIRWIYRTETIR